jgi:DNA-binding beta-propeller fold protein YncE
MPDARDDGEELDRFWNDLIAGRRDERGYAAAPDASGTVRAFQAMAKTPPSTKSHDRVDHVVFAAVERKATRRGSWLPADEGAVPAHRSHHFGANGASEPVVLKAEAIPPRPHWWVPTGAQIAMAGLVLGILVGSMVAFGGPWRQQEEESQHAMLPALAGTLERVWTSAGGPPVNFPYGLGIDPQGNIWVSDADNDRFQILAQDGAFVEMWGTPGDGEGEFEFYSSHTDFATSYGDVAFDTAGNIYVIDTGNFRVQKFAPDRTFLLAWGSEGEGDGQFLAAGSIAVGGDGTVYVADETRNDVQKFDGEGRWLGAIGSEGEDAGQFRYPAGVAVDAGGDIWVADFGNNRIQRLSADGEPLDVWELYGRAEGELARPNDVAIDALGRVYVADTFNHRLQVLAEDGRFLAEIGNSPDSWGLSYVASVAVTTDGVVVAAHNGGVTAYRLLLPAGDELMP